MASIYISNLKYTKGLLQLHQPVKNSKKPFWLLLVFMPLWVNFDNMICVFLKGHYFFHVFHVLDTLCPIHKCNDTSIRDTNDL
jgi:hypothetical protein